MRQFLGLARQFVVLRDEEATELCDKRAWNSHRGCGDAREARGDDRWRISDKEWCGDVASQFGLLSLLYATAADG